MRSVANGNVELTFATPVETIEYRELGGVAYFAKGALDRVAAALMLLVLALPTAAIAVAVKLSSPGPVFVRQTRVGRFGRPVTFYKFRSMRHDAEQVRDAL